MHISEAGLDLIKRFEGLRLTAYKCQAGVWTVGYGSTNGVHEGLKITQEQAEERLRQDCRIAEACVNDAVTVPLRQGQFDALVSFTFNLGNSAFRRSTLRRKVNAEDWEGAANEFMRWVYAGGKVSNGLMNRRIAEKAMFIS